MLPLDSCDRMAAHVRAKTSSVRVADAVRVADDVAVDVAVTEDVDVDVDVDVDEDVDVDVDVAVGVVSRSHAVASPASHPKSDPFTGRYPSPHRPHRSFLYEPPAARCVHAPMSSREGSLAAMWSQPNAHAALQPSASDTATSSRARIQC
jgi:hypothetical protein